MIFPYYSNSILCPLLESRPLSSVIRWAGHDCECQLDRDRGYLPYSGSLGHRRSDSGVILAWATFSPQVQEWIHRFLSSQNWSYLQTLWVLEQKCLFLEKSRFQGKNLQMTPSAVSSPPAVDFYPTLPQR